MIRTRNMQCYSILTVLLFLAKYVSSDPEILLTKAILRYTTDDNKHIVQQIQSLNFLSRDVVNGSQLRITTSQTSQMPVLFEGSFRNMENLQVLQIPKCRIEDIKPGAFLNVPNLDRIQLQDNLITKIENGVFNYMNISQLFLHRNKIRSIQSEAFDNMLNLHTIKLNANQLTAWDSNWFSNTPKLTDIFIRRNFITQIEENAFKNINKLQVGHEENHNSTNIYLSKNLIHSIHPKALSELVRLNNFFIDRNKITELPENLFDQIESITYLNLRRNKITKIGALIFPKVTRFVTLDLTKNELECIPQEVVVQAKRVLLEDNLINCACLNDLKKAIEEKGKGSTKMEVGQCVSGETGVIEEEEGEDDDEEEGIEEEEDEDYEKT